MRGKVTRTAVCDLSMRRIRWRSSSSKLGVRHQRDVSEFSSSLQDRSISACPSSWARSKKSVVSNFCTPTLMQLPRPLRFSRDAVCSKSERRSAIMSRKHPIISITGSSGAGTTSVKRTFEQIFRRENVAAAYIEGDAFHRYNRSEMRGRMTEEAERGNKHFSHFSPETNLFEELETTFRDYSANGTGRTRFYIHDEAEAAVHGGSPGTFSEWESLPASSDLLFYEGLHGAVVTDKVNVAQHTDLKIGVVPVINLEWIQKLHLSLIHISE